AARGIKLAALLAALAVAEGGRRAAVAGTLTHSAVRYGLLVAAGTPAAGQIPSHIAALAEGVTGAMFPTKAKIATVVLLAACVLAAAGALPHKAPADRGAPGSPPETAGVGEAAQAAAPAAQPKAPRENTREDKDTVTYAGRVLDAAGKPVAGASVYYHFITREDEPTPVRATTDA